MNIRERSHDGSSDYGRRRIVDPSVPRVISFEEAVARGSRTNERQRRSAPRFHRQTVIPNVPEGMQLVKFHGEPLLIPVRKEGEPLVNSTRYTEAQLRALMSAEQARARNIRLVGGRRFPLF